MSTSPTGGMVLVDNHLGGYRIRRTLGVFVLVWNVVFWSWGHAAMTAFCVAIAATLTVTGVPVTLTPDGFNHYKVWGRPVWLKRTVGGLMAAAVVLALLVRAPATWLLILTGFAVVANLWGWGVGWVGGLGGRRQAEPPSPEAAVLGRVSPILLTSAGMIVRSGASGMVWSPDILGTGIDDRQRPYFDVRVVPGRQTVEDFVKAGPRLASAWSVPRVIVTEPSPHVARVTGVLRESNITGQVDWGSVPREGRSVAEYVSALPMGADVETGDVWTLNLAQRNFVIGGLPGSGKSSFANALLAHLSLHPDVRIAFVDLKFGAEAAPWAARADQIVTNTPDDPEQGTLDAIEFISAAVADMGARYKRMIDAGVTNAWTEGFLGPDEPVKVLVIDECSELFKTDTPERSKMAARVISQLKSFVQQGRAAGYVLLMSTQYPKDENLPTSIREVCSDAIGFRVKSEKSMHAIFGWNYAPEDLMGDPTRISAQGQAVVVGSDGEAQRIQMAWIDKALKEQVVTDSARHRCEWLDQPATSTRPEPEPEQAADGQAAAAHRVTEAPRFSWQEQETAPSSDRVDQGQDTVAPAAPKETMTPNRWRI